MPYFLLFLACLLFSPPSFAEQQSWVYLTAKGDSLWNISEKYLNKVDHYTALQKINQITKPKQMKPGTLLRIPMQWLKHQPSSAQVIFLTGNAEYIHQSKTSPLQLKNNIYLGDEIHLGKDASATIRLADNTEITILKNSVIIFDHLSRYGETGMVDSRIRLLKGKIETKAEKSKGPGSRLDISTLSAVSSVRGTVFRVANDDIVNAATIEVIEGLVAVSSDEHTAIDVPAGQGTKVLLGQPPIKPVTLLPAPKLIAPQSHYQAQPRFRWQDQSDTNKAARYNIQIASDPIFSNIIWQHSRIDSFLTLPTLDDGHYYLRISAINTLGLEGIPANHDFHLNITPPPPELIDKKQLSTLNKASSSLNWIAKNASDTFQIEIAHDRTFSQVVLKEITDENSFQVPHDLAFSDYFWRVSTLQNNKKGLASAPISFSWQPAITPPSCATIMDSEHTQISWQTLTKNSIMHIQLALEPSFTQLQQEYFESGNKLTIQPAIEQAYFVRCRIQLDSSKMTSGWSETTHISPINKGIMAVFAFIGMVILI